MPGRSRGHLLQRKDGVEAFPEHGRYGLNESYAVGPFARPMAEASDFVRLAVSVGRHGDLMVKISLKWLVEVTLVQEVRVKAEAAAQQARVEVVARARAEDIIVSQKLQVAETKLKKLRDHLHQQKAWGDLIVAQVRAVVALEKVENLRRLLSD
ncbi:hypothetical protein ACLOJK_004169, partial [Asimina triloba]